MSVDGDTIQPATRERWRDWLERHHRRAEGVWLVMWKKASGKATLDYDTAVDEALCFGWIDGVRRKLTEDSYTNRFTPRKPKSNWSLVNIRKVEELIKQGLMMPPGLKAYEARDPERTGVDPSAAKLDPVLEKEFRAHKKAWDFFQAQPPGYRRTATWWVVSAKKDETRARRLSQLIEDSAAGRRLELLTSPKKKEP